MSLIEQAAQRLEQLRNVGVDIPPQSVAASVPETKPEQAKPLETIPQAAPAPAQDDQPLIIQSPEMTMSRRVELNMEVLSAAGIIRPDSPR